MAYQPDGKNQQNDASNIAVRGATGASQEQAPGSDKNREDGNSNNEEQPRPKQTGEGATMKNKERWGNIELKDRLMILATIGILAIAGFTGWIFVKQANVMQDQLDEMKGSGQQAEQLIILNTGQLRIWGKLAQETQRIAGNSDTANKNAQESFRKDQRAWLGPTGITFAIQEGQHPVITADIVNTGKTPALRVQTHVAYHTFLQGVEFSPIYHGKEFASTSTVLPGMHLATGQPARANAPTVSKQDLEKLRSGAMRMFFYGYVLYDDVFRRHHRTKFCVVLPQDLTGSPDSCPDPRDNAAN